MRHALVGEKVWGHQTIGFPSYFWDPDDKSGRGDGAQSRETDWQLSHWRRGTISDLLGAVKVVMREVLRWHSPVADGRDKESGLLRWPLCSAETLIGKKFNLSGDENRIGGLVGCFWTIV